MTNTTPNRFTSDATVLAMEFHRNGSGGVPFTVSKIRDEETGKIMIGITINEDTGYNNTMIIDAEKITEDRIGEKYPSCWRGTYYHDAIMKAKANLRRAGSLTWRRKRSSTRTSAEPSPFDEKIIQQIVQPAKVKWNKTEKIGGPDDQGSATSKCGRFRITKQVYGMVGCRWHWHTEVRVDLNAEGEDEQGQGWTGNWTDDDGNLFNWDNRGDFRTITEAKALAQQIADEEGAA